MRTCVHAHVSENHEPYSQTQLPSHAHKTQQPHTNVHLFLSAKIQGGGNKRFNCRITICVLPDGGFASPFGAHATCLEGWSWEPVHSRGRSSSVLPQIPIKAFSPGLQGRCPLIGPPVPYLGLPVPHSTPSSGQLDGPLSLEPVTGGFCNAVSRNSRGAFYPFFLWKPLKQMPYLDPRVGGFMKEIVVNCHGFPQRKMDRQNVELHTQL